MKRTALVIALICVMALLTACVSTLPYAGATGEVGSKVGMSTAKWYVFPYLMGDAGIVAAAEDGGITTIGTVDIKQEYYFLWGIITTIVTGE